MSSPRDGADRCPGLLRPFIADDGAIVRLRVPGGHLPVATLAEVLAVGADIGAPVVQLTSRGNLQLRALPDPLPAEAMDRLERTGLLPSATHERVRNILAAPLAPQLQPIVDELDDGLQADASLAGMPGRWLWAVTDASGSVLTEPWDAAYQALTDDDGLLLLAGPAGVLGMPCARHDAVALLLERARAFLASRPSETVWNARDLPDGSPVLDGLEPIVPTVAPPLRLGPMGTDLVVSVPLGMLRRPHVDALATVCDTVTVTPWRSLVVPGAATRVEELREAGLAVEDDSPWARLSACVGAPYCRRTESPTMDLATAAAPHLPDGSLPLHVVGCDRRCGEPHVDHVTVVAPTEVADLLAAVGGPRA